MTTQQLLQEKGFYRLMVHDIPQGVVITPTDWAKIPIIWSGSYINPEKNLWIERASIAEGAYLRDDGWHLWRRSNDPKDVYVSIYAPTIKGLFEILTDSQFTNIKP